jgi:hypothetical protein
MKNIAIYCVNSYKEAMKIDLSSDEVSDIHDIAFEVLSMPVFPKNEKVLWATVLDHQKFPPDIKRKISASILSKQNFPEWRQEGEITYYLHLSYAESSSEQQRQNIKEKQYDIFEHIKHHSEIQDREQISELLLRIVKKSFMQSLKETGRMIEARTAVTKKVWELPIPFWIKEWFSTRNADNMTENILPKYLDKSDRKFLSDIHLGRIRITNGKIVPVVQRTDRIAITTAEQFARGVLAMETEAHSRERESRLPRSKAQSKHPKTLR